VPPLLAVPESTPMPESNRPEQDGTGLETIRQLFLDSPTPMVLWPAIQPQTQQVLLSGQAQLAEAGLTNALADGRYSFRPCTRTPRPSG